MNAEKTVGMSFRVTPRTKRLLEAAAEHERRSLTNMLEILVEEFCVHKKINATPYNPSTTEDSKVGRTKK